MHPYRQALPVKITDCQRWKKTCKAASQGKWSPERQKGCPTAAAQEIEPSSLNLKARVSKHCSNTWSRPHHSSPKQLCGLPEQPAVWGCYAVFWGLEVRDKIKPDMPGTTTWLSDAQKWKGKHELTSTKHNLPLSTTSHSCFRSEAALGRTSPQQEQWLILSHLHSSSDWRPSGILTTATSWTGSCLQLTRLSSSCQYMKRQLSVMCQLLAKPSARPSGLGNLFPGAKAGKDFLAKFCKAVAIPLHTERPKSCSLIQN